MERWHGKLAVVTGASAGIGSAVCISLANAGMRVVGLARRPALVDKLQSEVQGQGSIVSRQCDVSSSADVAASFKWIEEKFGCVHALVNNAGVFYDGQITDCGPKPLNEDKLLSTFDINIKGPVMCTRHAVASMNRHKFDGHIITINSIAGHYVPFADHFNVYPSSKYAVTAFHDSLTNELGHYHRKIKTTSISPGLVATDMTREGIKAAPVTMPVLQPIDVADTVVYALSTPPHVNIDELTITPVSGLRL